MDFTFCLLSEQQQLLLPLEIDFALGLVLRGYLMNFGYLGKGDKGQTSLGSEDKNVRVHIPFVPFFDSVFLEPSQKQLERRRELEADKVGLQKPQKTPNNQFSLYTDSTLRTSLSMCAWWKRSNVTRDEVIVGGPPRGAPNSEFQKAESCQSQIRNREHGTQNYRPLQVLPLLQCCQVSFVMAIVTS